jgi:hypothetical protein
MNMAPLQSTHITSACTLTWDVPDKILLLTIIGDYTPTAATTVNAQIKAALDEAQTPLILLIDAMQMARPYYFPQIRATQTFINHRKLYHLVVGTNDKLVMLAMMIIFNLSTCPLQNFDTLDRATTFARGLRLPSTP